MIYGDGRALRFIGVIAAGWIVLRLILLWQDGGPMVDVIRGVLPLPAKARAAEEPIPAVAAAIRVAAPIIPPAPARPTPGPTPPPHVAPRPAPVASPVERLPEPVVAPMPPAEPQIAVAGPLAPKSEDAAGDRLSVSGWLIVRPGIAGGADAALAPQLGGTQGGVRIDYRLARGLAATARVAAPAAGAGREVSLGIAWRPAGVPIRVVAEHRFALDGARGGPAIGVSGGVDAVPLPAGFHLEGYGQAGAIFRRPTDRFVDGSARATRAIGTVGRVELDAGAGAWGGAQRGVARLDVGPTLGARIPVSGAVLRVAIDWRERIAGDARPGSGPALTVGTDF